MNEKFKLLDAYKLVLPLVAKHWLVREARAVKVYGEDRYRSGAEVPTNVCIAEDAMDLAQKIVKEYNNQLIEDGE